MAPRPPSTEAPTAVRLKPPPVTFPPENEEAGALPPETTGILGRGREVAEGLGAGDGSGGGGVGAVAGPAVDAACVSTLPSRFLARRSRRAAARASLDFSADVVCGEDMTVGNGIHAAISRSYT